LTKAVAVVKIRLLFSMIQFFLMIVVAVALHLALGWPLLVGSVIVAGIFILPGLYKTLLNAADAKPDFTGATRKRIIILVIAYVAAVFESFWRGHPSW
jgi:hypothetical protein